MNNETYITKTDYLNFVESKFEQCFANKNYIFEQPVNITSQVDPTIDFIGSKISPLKKYILEDNIGNPGRYLNQNSMKLKSLQYLKTTIPQVFGSYYKCMGVLAQPNIEKVVNDTFDYLTNPKYLGISPNDICIRINSEDKDLMNGIESVDPRIKREVNTVHLKHYRHKYGMDKEQITGRDFNIGIRKKSTEQFFNCGTFVVMETPEKPIAIDMGLGNCSLSMCKFGTNSTIESSRMADILELDSIEKIKFADSLIAVSTLLKEDILNHPSKHFRKKFRQYLNIMKFWNEQLNLSAEEISLYMVQYLNSEYDDNFEKERENWVKVLKK